MRIQFGSNSWLLLPRWQALELEAAARHRGMTTGQMLRRLIGDVVGGRPVAIGS